MSELNDYTIEIIEVSELIQLFDSTATESLSVHDFEYADLYDS